MSRTVWSNLAMALILRIDVDRPYGAQGLVRHIASRISTDCVVFRCVARGYLRELSEVLRMLNERGLQACVYFRKCSYPSGEILQLMKQGGHRFGLHLENSRTEQSFQEELHSLEDRLGDKITTFSKHGSGLHKYGRFHYAPYEPERYLVWAQAAGMTSFLGNLEDPPLAPEQRSGLLFHPAAFWLEPHWRDTQRFPLAWLLREAKLRDVVLLMHPDNVLADPAILQEFRVVLDELPTVLPPA